MPILARPSTRAVRHLLTAALFAVLAGCAKAPTGPDVTLTVLDLTVGTGATVVTGSFVTVTYTAWLYDPSKLDDKGTELQTTDGGAPYQTYIGLMQVISGWDLGLPGMQVGGVRRLIVPPELAYGNVGDGVSIPPGATLVYDITLLAVR